jgi:hypothetical protein
MQNFPNTNQLSGRAIGAIFGACFGTGWLFLGLAAKQMINPATVAGTMTGMTALLLTAALLLRQAKRWPRVPNNPAMGRVFGWVNAIQWIAIAITAFTLGRLHRDAYIPSAVAVIVGLHMFPLARLFHYPLHYATGTVLVGWAVATALFVPVNEMQGAAALGTGIILWLSAVVTLTIGLRAAGGRLSIETPTGGALENEG